MTAEFTGERIIPGQVDVDLWNEHLARYAFAARAAAGKRVLDVGCGTGYGSAALQPEAASVVGVDPAPEALDYARRFRGVQLAQASATALPLASASFDLVVCFEVIEHLPDWPALLAEARRVLTPEGALIVSTPNKSFYAETRRDSGPNPFHEHEFEYAEFRDALSRVFPHVAMYLEDHVEGIGFHPVDASPGEAETRIEQADAQPEQSSFFIAVCSAVAHPPLPPFVYIPSAANMLREKSVHIDRLQGEIATKDGWLAQQQSAHVELLARHAALEQELLKSNGWAADLSAQLEAAGKRIIELQGELAAEHKAATEMARVYEAQIAQLTAELEQRTQWARQTDESLNRQTAELARCVEILHQTEATLEERTRWAMALNEQREELEGLLAAARASRWLRIGRVAGLGPELQTRR
jgi:SAM-dependent methyltransferase